MSNNPGEKMQKIDMPKEFQKMSSIDRHYIKTLEALNTKRAGATKVMKGRNKITAAVLGGSVLGICNKYVFLFSSIM